MSLLNTRKFNTYSGISGKVVSPGAWIFHKGLTFQKRSDIMKRYKDLYGIWYVVTQLGEFSQITINELVSLSTQHPQWFRTFCGNLQKWLNLANPYDWKNLESQDPYGILKKESFEDIVRELIKKA